MCLFKISNESNCRLHNKQASLFVSIRALKCSSTESPLPPGCLSPLLLSASLLLWSILLLHSSLSDLFDFFFKLGKTHKLVYLAELEEEESSGLWLALFYLTHRMNLSKTSMCAITVLINTFRVCGWLGFLELGGSSRCCSVASFDDWHSTSGFDCCSAVCSAMSATSRPTSIARYSLTS